MAVILLTSPDDRAGASREEGRAGATVGSPHVPGSAGRPAAAAQAEASTHPEMNRQRPLTDLAANLIAERLRVLGQPLRVKLVARLATRATTVHELVDALGTTQQNISQHLGILRRAGIVARQKEGTRVRYQLADPGILPILERTESSLAGRLSAQRTALREGQTR
jgi:DNA-binding transcriptional ArsR family regulator